MPDRTPLAILHAPSGTVIGARAASLSPLVGGGGAPFFRRRSVARLSLFLLTATLLTGCGHRPDVMVPVPVSEAQTERVDMLVATTRQPSDNPALRYTGERGEDLRVDNIVVSIPPEKDRQIGQVQWPDRGKPDPRRSFVTVKADLLNDDQVMPWFQKTSHGKKRVLVFVHGFNNDYSESVYRFAQLVHDARIDAAPVLFTWPSRGNVLDYVYDRESTIYSRFGLGEVLKAAVDSPDVSDVTILAHSMGTGLAMEALRDMGKKYRKVPSKIRSVFLASPDIDVDVFQRQVLEMGDKRPQITILSSQNDLALKVSTWLAGDVQRLGATDFRPYEKLLKQYGITVIDASDAKQDDALGHSAFAQNADILKALGNTFLAKPEPGRGGLLQAGVLSNIAVAKVTP
ncbi:MULTISPECIES: alpha/beta hydrolase [Agrobacterium]|uniref:alpha/beta hydrolase n=1 Tax=Agrobacterium tumefaciens TaxID=358 RepID=UPI001572DA05|nr:alpha/beta fold hydrolase [Agrobacterium tumefaciens]NSZ09392.1 alpha/beta fold hydrolase [Agrobacterium tumefaciens]